MRRLITIVLVVATGLTPLAAHATAADGSRGSRDGAARWLAAQQKALVRLVPGPVFTGSKVGDQSLPTPDAVVPAGDLLGDGKQVVLDEREGDPADSIPLGLTARIGATGRAVWSRHFSEKPYYSTTFVPARLGAKGAPGVLVIAPGYQPDGTGNDILLTLTALSGATGKVIWSKTLSGFSPGNVTVSGTDLPYFGGLLTGGAAHTASVLVPLQTAGTDDTTDAELVSGVNGSTASYGPSESSVSGYAAFQAIPDTNHDGRSDVLLQVTGSGGFVRALSGTTGNSIWTASGLPLDSTLSPQPIGTFSSSSAPDLAFSYFDSGTNTSLIYVVSGKTGKVVWDRPGDGIYLIGKAGKHLVPALGLDSGTNTITSTSFKRTQTLEAISAANTVVYARTITSQVTLPSPIVSDAEYEGGVFDIGDVQPDGAGEIGAYAVTGGSDGTTSRLDSVVGVVNGRTGAFHRVAAQAGSDGSLRKGAGADLLAVGFNGHKPELTAWDGTTRHRLYRRTLAVGNWLEAQVGGLRVSGHPCSDVSVTTQTSTRGGDIVTSGSGHPLWLLRFAHSAVTGGAVKHFKKPKHFCV